MAAATALSPSGRRALEDRLRAKVEVGIKDFEIAAGDQRQQALLRLKSAVKALGDLVLYGQLPED